jgi:hypothetical protein
MVTVQTTIGVMDDTTRSTGDRHRSVINRSSRRVYFHLLSASSRREPGDSRASTSGSMPGPGTDLAAGRPRASDIPAILATAPFTLDLARPHRPVSWLIERSIRDRLGPLRGNVRMQVARRSGRLAAVAAFRTVAPDGRWVLEALAAEDSEDGPAIDTVLRQAVRDAGASGARRILARLPGDMTMDGVMRRSGFLPFATESVYLRNEDHADISEQVPYVRRVHPADVWAIHQLYLEVVPRQVQYAEAVTSQSWEGSRPLRPGARRSSGWVVEVHGRIRGYARVSTAIEAGLVRIDVLIDPHLRSLAPTLISTAVAEGSHQHGMPCVMVIPGYAHELHVPVQEAGFMHTGDQTAWVCYTTVPARSYIVAVDLGAHAPAEVQPARVPSFSGAGMSAAGSGGQRDDRFAIVGVDHESHSR